MVIDMAKSPTQEQMQQMMREEYDANTKARKIGEAKDMRKARMHDYDEYQKMLAKDFAAEQEEVRKIKLKDIRKVSSFAKASAKNAGSKEAKQISKEIVKNTPVTKSMLSVVAKGAGLLGAAVTMNEFRKVHKQIADNPTKKYGKQTLLDILMKD